MEIIKNKTMNEKTLQQIADELKNFQGNVKGEALRTTTEYVKRKHGDEGVKKLEEKLNELGVEIKLDEINPSEMISEGINALSIITCREIFNWTENDTLELGRFSFKTSFLTKSIIRYFVSLKMAINGASRLWDTYYDFGELKITRFSEEEKIIIIRKDGYKTHPTICLQHKGYFLAGIELVLDKKNVTIEEVKCTHKGDDYDEYVLKWD